VVGRRQTRAAANHRETYGARVLQLQQQLNQIKAQRAKQAAAVSAAAAATSSPYHPTSVRSMAVWRPAPHASHSPEKRSYYQQVRAKLMAEKKAQEQRRQKIYLAHLASIYGMAPPSALHPPAGSPKRKGSPRRKPSLEAASIDPSPAKERAEWQQVVE